MNQLSRLVSRCPPWVYVTVVTLGIGYMAIRYAGPQHAEVGLDAENNLPAFWSALLLFGAAGISLAVALAHRLSTWAGRFNLALAAIEAFIGYDEYEQVHEWLEGTTGVDWQILYLPLLVLAVVTGVAVLRDVWRWPVVVAIYVVAALAWGVAQAFEAIQWDGDVLVVPWLIYPEEILEMIGSALLGLGSLIALRRMVTLRDDALTAAHQDDETTPATTAR